MCTLKIPATDNVMLDVLPSRRYSETVNMNAKDAPNNTMETVEAIILNDGARKT